MKLCYDAPEILVTPLSTDDVIKTSGRREEYDGEWDNEL